MSNPQVKVWPDEVLKRPCKEVTVFDEKLKQLVIDLHTTMQKFNKEDSPINAAGLAAPQIGVSKRVFVYKLEDEATCMINPKILEKEGRDVQPEGCLSFPGIYISVERAAKILVEFQDVEGNVNRLRTDGFTARCIQHEMDHLDGITFLHALPRLKRDMMTRRLKKAKRRIDQRQKAIKESEKRMHEGLR